MDIIKKECERLGIDYNKYCEKALLVWGSIPLEVGWAIETSIYKGFKID